MPFYVTGPAWPVNLAVTRAGCRSRRAPPGRGCDPPAGGTGPRPRRRPASTRPSTRPRCREQTRSGCSSASSRNGQWAKAMTAPSSSATTSGSNPRRACSSASAPRAIGVVRPAGRVGPALLAPGIHQLVGRQTGCVGRREHGAGQHGQRRRLQAQPGRVGGQRVAVLGPARRRPATVVVTSSRPDLAHALEVRSHGVHVQAQHLGDVGGGQRSGRAGQLEVDGVAGVVPQRLEDVQAGRPRRVGRGRRLAIAGRGYGSIGHHTRLHGTSR